MPVQLSKQLIACASVTPEDAGCQEILAARLTKIGFAIEHLDSCGVRNLWATYGSGPFTLCFAGHTDVVPPGPIDQWPCPPFVPTVKDNCLYGRGASDMKTALAAMTVALERFLSRHTPTFRIALLITSDEEGPAEHGTKAALKQLTDRKERIEYCLVGEPSSSKKAGDTLKPGRRGSLHANVTFSGKQGHVAYPEQCINPIHALGDVISTLASTQWDKGDAFFLPTSFQLTQISSDSGAENVVPGDTTMRMNWRFSPQSTPEGILEQAERIFERCGLPYKMKHHCSARPFYTPSDSPFLKACQKAIQSVQGFEPQISTAGGTSDGRFFAPNGTHVVECGVVNATIHQVGEHIRIEQIEELTAIYEGILLEMNAAS